MDKIWSRLSYDPPLARTEVPGGWLYRTATPNEGCAMTFVPKPLPEVAAEKAKLVSAIRDLLRQHDHNGIKSWEPSSATLRARVLVGYGDEPCHGPQDTTCPSCGLGG